MILVIGYRRSLTLLNTYPKKLSRTSLVFRQYFFLLAYFLELAWLEKWTEKQKMKARSEGGAG